MKTNNFVRKCTFGLIFALIVSLFVGLFTFNTRAFAADETPTYDYVKLFNCDYNIGLSGLDALNKKEGRGALTQSVRTAGGGLNIIEMGNIKNANTDPIHIDASVLDIKDKDDLALGMWVWISDKTDLKGGDVRLSNAGYASVSVKDSIVWSFDEYLTDQLENGKWSWVVLEFSKTQDYNSQSLGDIINIISDIRYFRLHYKDNSEATPEAGVTTIKLDDIRLIRNTNSGKAAPTYDGNDKRVGYGTGDYMVKQLNEVDENAPAFYKFLNCDDDWTNYYYEFTKDVNTYKEGSASVSFFGTGVMQFFAGSSVPPYGAFGNSTFLQAPMEDRNVKYDVKDAYLGFWLYYDSAKDAQTLTLGRLELGSANSPDKDLFYFDINYFKDQISAESDDNWHWIVLPLSEASQLGSPNLNALNYFRLYINAETEQTNLKLDDIRIIKYAGADSLKAPDYSTEVVPAGAGTGVYPTKEAERYIYNVIDADATDKGSEDKLFYANNTKGAILTAVFAVIAVGACCASAVLLIKNKKRITK